MSAPLLDSQHAGLDEAGILDTLESVWGLPSGACLLGSFQVSSDGGVLPSPAFEQWASSEDHTIGHVDDLLERVAPSERAAVRGTILCPAATGSFVQLDLDFAPLNSESREVTLRGVWAGPATDPVFQCIIFETQSSEARRLADLALRYRTLTDVSPDIIIVHQSGRIVYVNPATVIHLRADSARDIVGKQILDFFSPASRRAFLERLSTMAETGRTASFTDEVVVAFDGTEIEIEATSIPTSWEGRPAYQAVARVVTERRAAERQVREQAALIDMVDEAIIVCGGTTADDQRIRSWSKGAERLYQWSEDEVIGRPLDEVLGDTYVHHTARGQDSRGGSWETEHRKRDGALVPVHVSLTVLGADRGQSSGTIVVATDISERVAEETARRDVEERYSSVVAALEEGILLVGATGTVHAANDAACRLLGVDHADLIGLELTSGPWDVVGHDGRPLPGARWPHQVTLRTGQSQANVVVGLERPSGTTWLSINSRQLTRSAHPAQSVVCSLSDITEAKAARERLEHAACHDSLTALLNRSGVTNYITGLPVARATRLAALFIDLDSFKAVNDTFGHQAGDQVLQEVARRLTDIFRNGHDIVGRLAGDEFVVLCSDLDTAAVAAVAQRVLTSVARPIAVNTSNGDARQVGVSASVGIAYLQEGESPQDILLSADVAMYAAKSSGGGRLEVFTDGLRQKARRTRALRADLRAALQESSLDIAYQPIVASSGELVGYEALSRWCHPTRGMIAPSEFIPMAEETGLISSLGTNVLREAVANASRLRSAGQDVYVSVNVSARQLADADFTAMVQGTLRAAGLPSSALLLEITEGSILTDASTTSAVLSELRELGVRLAIDDFGTGYSSLAYLETFPVDALKVDRSFVSALETKSSKQTLVGGIVSLAHSLDLSVIAEGVENESQADILRGIGVDFLQGYLYGRPGPLPIAQTLRCG